MTDATEFPTRRRYSSGWDEILAPLRPVMTSSTETKIALATIAVVILWGLAVAAFGVPALVWPMKLIVPGMVVGLVALTWGM